MRKQINDKLKSLTDLEALVGARIYRGRAPANIKKPYITWRIDGDDFDDHPINAPRSHDRAFLVIDIWSSSGPVAQSIADALAKHTADGGLDHDVSAIDGKDFTFLCDDAGSDENELQVPGSEQTLFNITQTWIVWHDPA